MRVRKSESFVETLDEAFQFPLDSRAGVPNLRYIYSHWYICTIQGVHWIKENNYYCTMHDVIFIQILQLNFCFQFPHF